MSFRPEDWKLLDVLSRLPSGMTEAQVSRLGLYESEGHARHALERLRRRGIVRRSTQLVRRISIDAPVFDPARDSEFRPGRIESSVRHRFDKVPLLATPVWHTTGLDVAKLEHDLHLAEVFLRIHRQAGRTWLSEKELAALYGARGHAQPDAAVADSIGNVLFFVDFIGCYRSARIRMLYEYASSKGVPIALY